MPDHYPEVEKRVEEWLHGEHEYQFVKNNMTHNADPQASLTYIASTEIRNKWHRFHLFVGHAGLTADSGLELQAGQQLLKSCGAARGALVWQYALDGNSVPDASEQTWRDLQDYYGALHTGVEALPQRDQLEAPLEEAISPATVEPNNGNYEIGPVFTRLSGLAIVYFADQQARLGGIVMPKPGVESGHIEQWL
jgi:hypothetical protein